MKTPDRFVKMIPGWEQSDADDMRAMFIPATTVLTLLRRQHADYVQLVKREKVSSITREDQAYNIAIEHILAA